MNDKMLPFEDAEILRARLAEAEAMLCAIRAGEVDAIVVGAGNPVVYTLKGAADPYRLLVERMSEGALTVSSDGVIVYCNAAFARIIRRPRERVVGSLLGRLLIGKSGEEQLAEFLERTSRGGQEVDFRADGGDTIHAHVSSTVLTVDDEPLHCLVVTDLTRQELRILHEAIVSFSPDAICSMRPDGAIASWNAAATTLFGYDAEEAIGESVSMLFPPEQRQQAEAWLDRARRGETVRFESVCVGQEGAQVEISIALSPIVAGEVHAIAMIARDVTEQKKLEAELRAADRYKDEFLATLAHELRNPLAPIRNGFTVLHRSDPCATLPKLLPMMERQLDHLVRLVDDLFDVSRISRGKFDLHFERCELSRLLNDAVHASQPHMDASGHRLSVEAPSAPVFIECDPTRLSQVFVNLLNNAAKYTPAAGEIFMRARVCGDEAIVAVRDNGIGISKDAIGRLFGLFAQGDFERTQRGLGVGLYLSRTLVEMHGGRIEGHSDGPGKGSEFIVRLPLCSPAAAQDRENCETESGK